MNSPSNDHESDFTKEKLTERYQDRAEGLQETTVKDFSLFRKMCRHHLLMPVIHRVTAVGVRDNAKVVSAGLGSVQEAAERRLIATGVNEFCR